MNLVADESVDRPIVTGLRGEGHSVWYVAELDPGIMDDTVLDLANQQDCILLTADHDFGELVFRQKRITSGVVLIRLEGLSLAKKTAIVLAAVREHSAEMSRAFTVITPGGVRIRPQRTLPGAPDAPSVEDAQSAVSD